MVLMKELKLGKLYYEISRHNVPALTINPGETVKVETEDTFNGLVRTEGDHRDLMKKPYGNPQSGPIHVTGAEKGDTLVVHITKIEARLNQAATDMTYARRGLGEFLGLDIPVNTRVCPVRDSKVWWSPSFSLPYFNMARWYATQGNTAEAIDWLEKAVSRGYANWEQIKFDPLLESIRDTEGYKTLLKGH